MKDTAIVDLEVFNQALLLLQNLSGEVSHVKVHPIVQTFAQSIIPPPKEDKDELGPEEMNRAIKRFKKAKKECHSPTPQKSSSEKSATGQ